jgi:hypothetical protein
MFSGTAQFSHQVCQFFVSSVCLLVRVTMVDKNNTRSVHFNDRKGRLSCIHFGTLSALR